MCVHTHARVQAEAEPAAVDVIAVPVAVGEVAADEAVRALPAAAAEGVSGEPVGHQSLAQPKLQRKSEVPAQQQPAQRPVVNGQRKRGRPVSEELGISSQSSSPEVPTAPASPAGGNAQPPQRKLTRKMSKVPLPRSDKKQLASPGGNAQRRQRTLQRNKSEVPRSKVGKEQLAPPYFPADSERTMDEDDSLGQPAALPAPAPRAARPKLTRTISEVAQAAQPLRLRDRACLRKRKADGEDGGAKKKARLREPPEPVQELPEPVHDHEAERASLEAISTKLAQNLALVHSMSGSDVRMKDVIRALNDVVALCQATVEVVVDEFKQDTEDSKVIDLASLDSLPIIDTGAAIPTIDATTETWIIADIVSVSACTCM